MALKRVLRLPFGVCANLPGEVPKVLTSSLAEDLERFSDKARVDFLKRIQVVAIKKTPDGPANIQ